MTLRRSGTPIPTNDVWIAACAARDAATVVTYGGHFGKVGSGRGSRPSAAGSSAMTVSAAGGAG